MVVHLPCERTLKSLLLKLLALAWFLHNWRCTFEQVGGLSITGSFSIHGNGTQNPRLPSGKHTKSY